MSGSYKTVRLIQNRLYPTYQLHAYMANRKTPPKDGLRLGALSVLDWLRRRLGEPLPEKLRDIPSPDQYKEVDSSCLTSLHLNCGFIVDIVSLPEQGLWSLQITEPDLGSDPGNPNQLRKAVPGRLIQTNVGFRICESRLECGFQTLISDPEGTADLAEVYRLAVVRRLVDHPDFGLRHVTRLTHDLNRITGASSLRSVKDLWHESTNYLPCVVFTRLQEAPSMPSPEDFGTVGSPLLPHIPAALLAQTAAVSAAPGKASDPDYDLETFAKYGVTFCRSYLLDESLFDAFAEMIPEKIRPGDAVVLYPVVYGGKYRIYPYRTNKASRQEVYDALKKEMYSYPRERVIDYGSICFLSAAQESLLHRTECAVTEARQAADIWAQKLSQLESEWESQLDRKDEEIRSLSQQLSRQKEYSASLEQDKDDLRRQQTAEFEKFRLQLDAKEEYITYLKRKMDRPSRHEDVAAWTEKYFADRLILHDKAKALMADRSAKDYDLELICDALDFLATDYWECRYSRIPEAEMNSRCSQKYGRPFPIRPVGLGTIEFTPAEYKIKYFPKEHNKARESALDYHLCVGNDSENLLRIYFLHDDKKQLIVVGSLPKHLTNVKIK